ncbi:phosphoglycerate dehydrogenase [Gemmatimonas groenlandica]|uniref:D-3-phosphoglycerate dehydrogenase n=1 Tax=Gemmatimonas groenlandica TaxID=2732249 RepID=A0A6M4ISX4_9BACT|nr:phosphoglycerate dehydrogenase [Gemmatimonas groenlandica]QJR36637.1 phosphoglycerate dehydrogenase [Gemmatimonas groenlandica]
MAYRVLVTDDVDPEGLALLAAETELLVDEVPTLPKDELLRRIGDYDAIVGRSATKISAELLRAAKKLRVVGRAGVGVDNIALDVATELGVAIINAPAGNTVAVAELFFGTVIGLLRQLPAAALSMQNGVWDRSKLMGRELKGKTLGIVGLGRIGSEVAMRAHAFGMTVVAFDPYIADERFTALRVRRAASLDALIAESNILTMHVPLNDETRGMIGKRELGRLPARSIVVNMARGGIVDEAALLAALEADQLRGAVLDVFTAEPLVADSPLRTAPNLLLTPHLGANTVEAQRNVSRDVCLAVRDALLHNDLSKSINVAGGSGEWGDLQPAMLVARRAAAVARAVLADQGMRAVRRLALRIGPDLAHGAGPLLAAAAAGVLEGVIETDRLNLINARSLAEARGLELSVGESNELGHPRAIEIALAGGMQQLAVAGVAPEDSKPRLTRIGQFHVDVNPRQTLLILTNHDVPGVIGRVGTLLGERKVNIAEYHQARLAQGGDALAAISVDGAVSEETRKALLELPDVLTASVAHFGAE